MAETADLRSFAPAAARNREPILAVLGRVLTQPGFVLEIASGSGEHALFFARALSHLTWQPSDPDARALVSIAAHRQLSDLANVLPPVSLDVTSSTWPVTHADAVVCINMIHIAPWEACAGLMAGCVRVLPEGGTLFLYGPFKEDGNHTADSNRAFDEDLRRRNPLWGVRDLEAVIALAARHCLIHAETVVMPANNRSVIFKRRA